MSDVSKTNEELRKALNVAREHFSAIAASGEIKVWEDTGEKRGIDYQAKVWAERGARLASEALAATRVPTQGEPNDDREALIREALEQVREIAEAGRAGEPLRSIPKDADPNWGWLQTMWPVAVTVDVVLSRATVPDAATELAAIKARAEEVGQDEGWHIGGVWGDYGEVVVPLRILSYVFNGKLDEKVVSTDPGYAATYAEQVSRAERAEAERDAALAAVERVRAIAETWRYGMPEYTSSTYQEGQKDQQRKLVGELLAALAGAPEPEVAEAETGVRPWADRFRYAGSDAGNGVLARGFERAKAERERQARLDVLRGQSTDDIVNGLQLPAEGESRP